MANELTRETKIKNLKEMIPKLNGIDLKNIYNLIWSLTAKDLLIRLAEKEQIKKELKNNTKIGIKIIRELEFNDMISIGLIPVEVQNKNIAEVTYKSKYYCFE